MYRILLAACLLAFCLSFAFRAAGADERDDTEVRAEIEKLTKAIDAGHEARVDLALAHLIDLGSRALPAVPVVLRVLDLPSDRNRFMATRLLARLGPSAHAAMPRLLRLVRSKDTMLRYGAESAAQAIGFLEPSSREALRAVLDEADLDARFDLLFLLRPVDIAPLSSFLVEVLEDEHDRVRVMAAYLLANADLEIDKAAAVALEVQAKAKAPANARGDAVHVLGLLPADRFPQVESLLLQALAADESLIRAAGARSLGLRAHLPPMAVPLLEKALADADENVRLETAGALAKHGERTKEVVAALVGLLDSADWVRQATAASALGDMGSRAVGAVAALERVLGDPATRSRLLRDSLTEALEKIGAR